MLMCAPRWFSAGGRAAREGCAPGEPA